MILTFCNPLGIQFSKVFISFTRQPVSYYFLWFAMNFGSCYLKQISENILFISTKTWTISIISEKMKIFVTFPSNCSFHIPWSRKDCSQLKQ